MTPTASGAPAGAAILAGCGPPDFAKPKGSPKGALLVFHEWWGLNEWVKHQADELAGLGYLALAVDLYKGKVAKDPQTAQKLMGAKDESWGDKVEEAGLEWLHKNAS